MTRTTLDNALLLQVIAGPDHTDDRQINCPPLSLLSAYHTLLLSFPAQITASNPQPLHGMKLGLIKESVSLPGVHPDMVTAVRRTAERFQRLGAEVVEVSVPEHGEGGLGMAGWSVMARMGFVREAFECCTNGRTGLQLTDLAEKMRGFDEPERFAQVSPLCTHLKQDSFNGSCSCRPKQNRCI